MSYNHSDYVLTKLVTNFLSDDISNYTNHSEVTQTHLFDLYEAYRTKEREQLSAYKSIAYVFGVVIFLSNLTVVISSGLIIKKGQQPKSTYLLLGNVSLADTIIGISIIFGASVETATSSNTLCIFQIGMLVCPAMVSIFSVGMIAVDRYIYILHGLYYQRWCNTTKVRIIIMCIWMIGLTLGFMPVTGLVNEDHIDIKCTYVSLFPSILILINSLLSIIPILLVAVLYTIILFKALKNAKQINNTLKTVRIKSSSDASEIRAYRGHGNYKATQSVKVARKLSVTKIKRSASFDTVDGLKTEFKTNKDKSKSTENLSNDQNENGNLNNGMTYSKTSNKRVFDTSFLTISTSTIINDSIADIRQSPHKIAKAIANCTTRYKEKMKEPNRLRAVLIVMLTTGSFITTWIPFFITAIFYVFCEEKMTNPKCIDMRILLRGPLAVTAFCNNILNPLIYAWWHKGFQQSIKTYFQKYIKSIFKNPYL
ncbi:PREDICTED: glucose-dependent insulinotropic receptor-like isoform X1 [Papilio xuthus]|uniref:5-hydroxytryptamine receptor 1A n=1 Tax=Papilio xuthus TaxID=66420 RepID=A0A194PHM0_PAPXU|nr:PREDICTED: glucose-dependent insulinotropic receptor-like isoform X1 [Papilio xuthus]KPI92214.1 5-hydroxytryptamine receptor 1A [Papilio xuthus]